MAENTNWKEVERPARKADYHYKFVWLSCPPPEDGQMRPSGAAPLPIRIGDVLQISMRRNARDTWSICSSPGVSRWGDIRVLELHWKCAYCASTHAVVIPESWIDEGKAVFVERVTEGESHE